jgi:hypothetical protein
MGNPFTAPGELGAKSLLPKQLKEIEPSTIADSEMSIENQISQSTVSSESNFIIDAEEFKQQLISEKEDKPPLPHFVHLSFSEMKDIFL